MPMIYIVICRSYILLYVGLTYSSMSVPIIQVYWYFSSWWYHRGKDLFYICVFLLSYSVEIIVDKINIYIHIYQAGIHDSDINTLFFRLISPLQCIFLYVFAAPFRIMQKPASVTFHFLQSWIGGKGDRFAPGRS
jgi:hypothetical protein